MILNLDWETIKHLSVNMFNLTIIFEHKVRSKFFYKFCHNFHIWNEIKTNSFIFISSKWIIPKLSSTMMPIQHYYLNQIIIRLLVVICQSKNLFYLYSIRWRSWMQLAVHFLPLIHVDGLQRYQIRIVLINLFKIALIKTWVEISFCRMLLTSWICAQIPLRCVNNQNHVFYMRLFW